MASILLLDSLAASATRLRRLLTTSGHAVHAAGDVALLLRKSAGAPFLIVVRDHVGTPVDARQVRRLRTSPRASGLLVLAPAVRWVVWVGVADRVLPEGASGELLLDAIRKLGEPAPAAAMAPVPRVRPDDGAATADAADAPPPVLGIAGYRILRLIGRGGMSIVYLAAHEASGESRVIKLLPISEHDGGVLVQRLINEAALLSQLRHPGIVRIHEQGFTEWHAYIAMEYLPGGELTVLLGQPLPPPLVIEIVLQIAEALHAIHGAGMVHRDLKPANILRRDDGTFVLADFGIARKQGVHLSRTGPGHLVGTAAYLAPETIDGGRIDHRSDLYALGVLLHEMLTGRKPFQAASALEVMDLHLHAPVPRLPAALGWAQPLVDGLMAKCPEDRFDGADSLVTAVLRAVAEQQASGPATGGAITNQHRSHADAG
jgi:tRNA A-37 threonylcarbamoyl transferase component Bud32